MLDRALGFSSIAIGLICWALPSIFPQFPLALLLAGMGVGVFLGGTSVGMILTHWRAPRVPEAADSAILRLRIYGDVRLPESVFKKGIFYWYYLPGIVALTRESGEVLATPGVTTVFLSFDPEVKPTNLRVRSLEGVLPPHEIKVFNQRFAIVAFFQSPPHGMLELAVEP